MRRRIACVIAFVLPSAAFAQDRPQAEEGLPVTRVVLYASGVGYFEHEGTVEGDRSVTLTFDAGQINDVLKSMVLMDLDGGQVRSVAYPSREPVERALSSFAVNLAGNPSLPDLLNQLRGAQVTVTTTEKITGAILNVTAATRVVGDPPAQVVEHTLNLLTDTGIVSLPMSSIARFELQDPKLREEMSKAMTLLAESRNTEQRPVELRFEGEGTRRVRVGYLVETPVWKTAYRLDLSKLSEEARPEGEDASAFLQGWAIVENTSEADWGDVTLSLVSGQPISFAMDLYTPLFVRRPVAQVPRFASLQPRTYDRGIPPAAPMVQEAQAKRMRAQNEAPEFDLRDAVGGNLGGGGGGGSLFDDSSVDSAATGAVLGELFQFTLDHPIDLARRRSAMLPIVTQAVKAEKLSIYNPEVHEEHPLHGARLTNNTGLKLLGGPITVFDAGAYAGDALIELLPPDETRLISYGVDADVSVQREEQSSDQILSATIVKGVLHVTERSHYDTVYQIDNRSKEPRTLLIESERWPGVELVEPAKFDEQTEDLFRFRVDAPAGEVTKFITRLQSVDVEHIAIANMSDEATALYLGTGAIDERVRAALEQAAAMKAELVNLQRQLDAAEAELNGIKNGQQRLRENLRTIDQNSTLGKRYLGKLATEEDQIEALDARVEELRPQIDAARKRLEDHVGGMNVE